MEHIVSERTVEMVIGSIVLLSHTMEACVPQGSPAWPILFAIHSAGLIKWLEERVQAKGLSFVDDCRCVGTGKDVNLVVAKHYTCTAASIQWASRQDLHFDTAEMEAALCTQRKGHNNHLHPSIIAKINVGNGFVRFNTAAI
jgi:hypothetical protein